MRSIASSNRSSCLLVKRVPSEHCWKPRAPNDPTLRVIARNIELGSQLIAAGDWACMYTMPGDARVVHCVDPVRRIHVTSEPLTDNIMLYGIELTPKPHLVLHHTWYRDCTASRRPRIRSRSRSRSA